MRPASRSFVFAVESATWLKPARRATERSTGVSLGSRRNVRDFGNDLIVEQNNSDVEQNIYYIPRVDIFSTPVLLEDELLALSRIEDLRGKLRWRVAEPRRWYGGLRRLTFARAVQGSNSIEGYDATLDDVVAADAGDSPFDADGETFQAVQGYRDAMTYVLQLAEDDHAPVDESLIRALHFMMLRYDLSKWPGRWRPGPIFVSREKDGEIVYEGPDHEQVPDLVKALVESLRVPDDSPSLVKAAMAHLNLAMIHPFRDGNGRMARCLQTLILARDRIVAPVFSSIEEHLGRNTQAYYDVLGDVGQGHWNPQRDARAWMRFCIEAHYRQATTVLRRVHESEELWGACEALARDAQLPERSIAALFDAALDLRIRNGMYRRAVGESFEEEISENVASRDLKLVVNSGLLEARGETRGRYYVAGSKLRDVRKGMRSRRVPRSSDDPFAPLPPPVLPGLEE